jgi:hypothetical protein
VKLKLLEALAEEIIRSVPVHMLKPKKKAVVPI